MKEEELLLQELMTNLMQTFISYAGENDGYKYLLVVIDIFSRYGWVQPLKDKSSNEVIKAFDKILTEGRKPNIYILMQVENLLIIHFRNTLKQKI